jgi:hypothetical protein
VVARTWWSVGGNGGGSETNRGGSWPNREREREREREAYRTLWVAEGEEAAVPDRELVKKNEWA